MNTIKISKVDLELYERLDDFCCYCINIIDNKDLTESEKITLIKDKL